MVLWVGLQRVIVVFPGHIHLRFSTYQNINRIFNGETTIYFFRCSVI